MILYPKINVQGATNNLDKNWPTGKKCWFCFVYND
jgi:hypothetical protein